MKRFGLRWALAGALLVGLSAPALASVDVQKALDRPVDLEVSETPVGEVFLRLTEKTGVPFDVDPYALELLPYGEQTRLTVSMKNVTLRKALPAMLGSLSLQWSVEGDRIHVYPGEALARIGRRVSYDELATLQKLRTGKLTPPAQGASVIEQLRAISGNPNLDLSFAMVTDRQAALDRAAAVLPGTAMDFLDALVANRPWAWYLWGDEVRIVTGEQQVRRQLDRQVSLRYRGAKLSEVLLDLARQGRIPLEMEPGVLQMVPADARESFNLVMADASIAEALQVISGATGLAFEVTHEGVRVEASDALTTQTQGNGERRRSPFFVRMSLPGPEGVTIDIFLRSDELPDEVVQRILAEKQKLIEALGGAPDPPAALEQVEPDTQPTE